MWMLAGGNTVVQSCPSGRVVCPPLPQACLTKVPSSSHPPTAPQLRRRGACIRKVAGRPAGAGGLLPPTAGNLVAAAGLLRWWWLQATQVTPTSFEICMQQQQQQQPPTTQQQQQAACRSAHTHWVCRAR